MPLKIVLKGYYGFGNLGDDVLLKVTYNWLRTHFSEHEIVICTDSPDPSYIHFLIGSPVRIINSDEPLTADFILHGGGGQYFDFKKGSWKNRVLNAIITFIGPSFYRGIYQLYRNAKGTTGLIGKTRMGIGIGIGHYTLSSGRFYADVLELSDFVFLRVRDRQSITALHRLNKKCDVKVSTDVAFLERLLPKTPKEQTHQKVAGFILRDWAYDDGYLASIEEVADNLLEQGYGVRFYSLDKLADRNYCKRFAEKYTLDVWDPWQVSVDEFLAKIEECTMIISSRAHGAILANYKSLPVVILEIEPKLTHIHLLLKESTFPVKIPIDKIALVSLIKEIASRAADLSAIAKSEYNSNQQQVLEAFDELREFMELRMKA